jgi:hypothetical protein
VAARRIVMSPLDAATRTSPPALMSPAPLTTFSGPVRPRRIAPAPRLNVRSPSDPRFLFHYTDVMAARAIFVTRTVKVGRRHPRRPGFYVCGYAPGAATPAELRSLVLDGTPDWRRRTCAVVVIEDLPPLSFERDDVKGNAWCHRAETDAELYLPIQILGYGVRERGSEREWRLSYGCYEE